MGRLPKKKSAAKKEKKHSKAPIALDEANSGAAVATAAPQATPGREIRKKRPAAAPKKPAAPSKPASGEPNFIRKSIQFLREVRVELKKVTWPSRKQTIGSTLVVIILVMIISAFLGIVDVGLSSLVRVVLQ